MQSIYHLHGLASSSYVLKQLVVGNCMLVIAGFYTRAINETEKML